MDITDLLSSKKSFSPILSTSESPFLHRLMRLEGYRYHSGLYILILILEKHVWSPILGSVINIGKLNTYKRKSSYTVVFFHS